MSTNTGHTSGNTSAGYFGKTIFGTIQKFPKLDESKTLNTDHFLQACKEVANILDRLGAQFSVAKKDMLGNIKRIEDRFKMNPSLYVTLNAILEEDSKASVKATSAVIGVIWLKRGLQFLFALIVGLKSEGNVQDENLRSTVLQAYEATLKPYHGKVSRFMFSSLSRFVPSRSNFIKALMLSEDATLEMLFTDIDLYLPSFQNTLDFIESLLNQYRLNLVERS